ncbi:hypothetical protein H7K20_12640 [Priestia aryabhattai]|uniref:hypothetical protein n=1 Tax=Priestia aryabhattai TaxID=412384 RepID=UPI001C8D279F|nr:hypothetical protein [Priestia aryabhattai]MBY0027949.1 hypothetical protein [Priestia aryabhattai]
MTQILKINNAIEEVELQEKLYPIRENWHLLKPYLNDEDVQAVLDKAMTDFCLEHPRWDRKMWTSGDAPWDYTTSCYWHDQIFDAVQEDENFQKEQDELFQKLYGSNSDDEDDLWNELLSTEEYQALDKKYYDKHSPQEGTIDWYKFIHGCHWINQFTAALVSKALNVEAFVLHTTTHTCATFVEDDIVYYVDIQLDWENLQELLDFLGEEVDFYPIFE